MTIRAASHDLDRLRELLNHPEVITQRLLENAAAEAKRLVQMGFRTETDPDGAPWERLKSRKGKILRDTARMANSFTSVATNDGFRIGSNVKYTVFHQEGTKGHKAYHRRQNVNTESGLFVRNKTRGRGKNYAGFARVATGGTQVRHSWRNGKQITFTVAPKRVLTDLGAYHPRMLQFKEGGGKIPIRRMVPEGGELTSKWMQAIDRACSNVMMRAVVEAGGRP
jgi:phage gpG-like protein